MESRVKEFDMQRLCWRLTDEIRRATTDGLVDVYQEEFAYFFCTKQMVRSAFQAPARTATVQFDPAVPQSRPSRSYEEPGVWGSEIHYPGSNIGWPRSGIPSPQ
jgi:hypothetical protein